MSGIRLVIQPLYLPPNAIRNSISLDNVKNSIEFGRKIYRGYRAFYFLGDCNHGDVGGASRHYSIFFRVRLYRAPRVGHLLALFGGYDGYRVYLEA